MTKKTTSELANKPSLAATKVPLIKKEEFEREEPEDLRENGCFCNLFRSRNKPLLSLEINENDTVGYTNPPHKTVRK